MKKSQLGGRRIAVALLLHAQAITHAGFIVGNLDQATANNSVAIQFNSMYFAQEFNVGSQAYTLSSIMALLGNQISPTTNFAELVTDGKGRPDLGGGPISRFDGAAANPGSNVEFDPTASGVMLAANTNYWFVLESTSGTGFYEWGFVGPTLTTGSVGTLGSFEKSVDNGATWLPESGTARGLIQVNGTPLGTSVPEPSSLILMGLGGAIGIGAWLRRCRQG